MTSFDTIQDSTSLAATPCDSDFMDNEYFFDRVKNILRNMLHLQKHMELF